MASSIAFRVIMIWAVSVFAYTLFTGGISATGLTSIIGSNSTYVLTLIGTILVSAVVASIFIGAFVVAPVLIFFLNLVIKNVNPFGSAVFALATGAPPGLSNIIILLGYLVTVATYLIVSWAFIDIIA